ncbi:MAG: sensor histidine kinase [Spirochaetales bacterium]|nr:sensor histidine kinase [Spirochaetales bacterium]
MKKLIEKFNKLLNNLNIRVKLLISFFLAVFIPVIILGVIFINRTVDITRDFTVRNFLVDVERIEKKIIDTLKTAKTLSDRFYVDERLKSILINNFTSLFELTEVLNKYTDFDYYLQLYKEIVSIRVYTTNVTIKENWRFMNVTPQVEETFWYQQAKGNQGKPVWSLVPDKVMGKTLLRLARSMPFFEGMPFSILTVDIDTDIFSSLLNEEAVFILLFLNTPGNEEKSFVSSGGKMDIRKDIEQEKLLLSSGSFFNEKMNTVTINAKSFYKVIQFIEGITFLTPFSFIALFPMEQLNTNKRNMLSAGFVLVLICLIVSSVLIYIFSQYFISKRIRLLGTEMHKIASGNLDVSIELEGKDEIGYLSRDIMKMIHSLKELMKKVYEADLQKKQFEVKQKDMEFKLLASQINPHFFFNALETIRAKARSNRIGELEEIVKSLGRIMRKSLEIQQNPVSVESEIEFTLHYLEIQKYRFEEKLEYEIKISETIKEFKIIPHLFQPLVENAIIHGIEQKIGGGKIIISSSVTSSSILFIIEDNGMGIKEEKLAKIKRALSFKGEMEESFKSTYPDSNGPHGIGLINVHHRIRLYYGIPYGLTIESMENAGTKVEIILPNAGGK